jgi:hypothetical protein
MIQHRSLFFHGLGLTFRRFPALLWAFAFNFIYAALNSAHFAANVGRVTDTSLAAQSLHHGFDLGTIAFLNTRLVETGGVRSSFGAPVLLYLTTYFLLVPGTLLCYQTGAPARLSTLLHAGLLHFWRFVRITILTLLVSAIILGPLAILQSRWADHVDEHAVGRPAFFATAAGILVIALIAAVLRLYFDLVEVYTVQLGLQIRPNGKPDRRVRKALVPAFRALRQSFGPAYITFLFLSFLGFASALLAARIAMHSLAKPHVWLIFLLSQIGLFLMLLTRFWQRGAETTLSLNYPIFEAPVSRTTFVPREPPPPSRITLAPIEPITPVEHHVPAPPTDPIPSPEPSTPSLAEPDPGIYHHEVEPHEPPKPDEA